MNSSNINYKAICQLTVCTKLIAGTVPPHSWSVCPPEDHLDWSCDRHTESFPHINLMMKNALDKHNS